LGCNDFVTTHDTNSLNDADQRNWRFGGRPLAMQAVALGIAAVYSTIVYGASLLFEELNVGLMIVFGLTVLFLLMVYEDSFCPTHGWRKNPQPVADPTDQVRRGMDQLRNGYAEFDQLMKKFMREIEVQHEERNALETELAELRQLLSLKREQAEVWEKRYLAEYRKQAKHDRRGSRLHLLIGLLASIPIGICINLFTP
jgi:hypothetical protein